MGPTKQDLINKLYNIENVVTVAITIPASDWTELANANPKFGFKEEEADRQTNTREEMTKGRYDWHKAPSVVIKGTTFPSTPLTFTNVGVIKKSFAGSRSQDKPSIRLDFDKFNPSQGKVAEESLGLKNLTLNNSVQDPSYVRQIIGYDIFRQAGLPFPLCNYAKVTINGDDYGAYINLEPFKKAFVERNFGGNDKGNLYEIELHQDLVEAKTSIPKGGISFEGFSKFEDLADLQKAAAQLKIKTLAAASQVVDMDNFIRYYALEIILKHWDGYAIQRNNTYLYNDVVAVANPEAGKGNVKIKFIPSGIDQILQVERDFVPGAKGVVAALVLKDKDGVQKLRDVLHVFSETIFSQGNLDRKILPLIKKLEAIVNTVAKKPSDPIVTSEVDTVRRQLGLIPSAVLAIKF